MAHGPAELAEAQMRQAAIVPGPMKFRAERDTGVVTGNGVAILQEIVTALAAYEPCREVARVVLRHLFQHLDSLAQIAADRVLMRDQITIPGRAQRHLLGLAGK